MGRWCACWGSFVTPTYRSAYACKGWLWGGGMHVGVPLSPQPTILHMLVKDGYGVVVCMLGFVPHHQPTP